MRVSLINIGIIVATLLAVLGITLLVMRIARWRRDVALRRHGVPQLVMPLEGSVGAPRPVLPREDIGLGQRTVHQMPSDAPRRTPASTAAATGLDDEDTPVAHERVDTGPFRAGEVRAGLPSAHLVAGSQVRFFRAEEGTLEFLPGHLEVVGGDDIGQEIHFARQVGETDATITFGRSEGAPLRHVQLLDPTVSRQHAVLTYTAPTWSLTNLSTTNPVVVNESALDEGSATLLVNGDRIEMGAVVFVFHAR